MILKGEIKKYLQMFVPEKAVPMIYHDYII